MKLSGVMSVYGEAKTVREILARVLAIPIEKGIPVGDGGSSDGTAANAR